MTEHVPVLLHSAMHYLAVKPGDKYIDATLGGGGHAGGIVRQGGLVLGLDQDFQALSACPALEGLVKVHANFTDLADVAKKNAWSPVSGILYDLGVSAFQIDVPARGFSFRTSGPLDMRMDVQKTTTAAEIINDFPPDQLEHVLRVFGEVAGARSLVQRIVSARPVATTLQLAGLAGKNARRVFQALRIAVNDELGALEAALPQTLDLLRPGGRLVVISFHSLEDRMVKHTFANWSTLGLGEILTPKPIGAGPQELVSNPRSHSAKLRAFKKI